MILLFYKQYAHKALDKPQKASVEYKKQGNKAESSCSVARNLIRKFCDIEVLCAHSIGSVSLENPD